MNSEVLWFEKPLGAVTCNHDGKRKPVKESERKKGPYPYYGASGIVDYVDGYLFEGRHLLIAEDGENLRTRQTPIAFIADGRFWVNNHAHIVTGNGEVTTEYLHYFLQNADIQPYLTGAVMPKLTQGNLNRIPVRYPEPDYQKSIVRVLGALDAKIDLNRRTNQTLEAMAQAIFKSWFVDFDPVKAKIAAKHEGRDALRAAMSAISGKSDAELDVLAPGQFDQLAATAALFPDEMEESNLGGIPRGWNVSKVEVLLARLSTKTRYTKGQLAEFGQTPVFEQGASVLLGYHDETATYRASATEPMFIFGDHTCVTRISFQPFDISQNVIPLQGRDRPTAWAYYAVREKQKFQEYRRHWMELISKDVVIADVDTCLEFSRIVSSLHLQIEANERQSQVLRELLNTLLPKLLSGELAVTAPIETGAV